MLQLDLIIFFVPTIIIIEPSIFVSTTPIMFLKGMYIIMGESLGKMTLDKFGNNYVIKIIGFIKKIIISIIFSWLYEIIIWGTRLVS